MWLSPVLSAIWFANTDLPVQGVPVTKIFGRVLLLNAMFAGFLVSFVPSPFRVLTAREYENDTRDITGHGNAVNRILFFFDEPLGVLGIKENWTNNIREYG